MIINSIQLLQAQPIRDMLMHKVQFKGVSHGLAEAGYDIRLKQQITFDRSSAGDPIILTDGDYGTMKFGRFVLGSAIEEFQMPGNLVGIVHDKSTWARKGLSVFNTVIEPGWKGFLTLELVYNGREPLIIPAGVGIAQVLFHQVAEIRYYAGKYQYQADEPVPSKFE